jgi:DNA-binding FadR family transcriptional regulator
MGLSHATDAPSDPARRDAVEETLQQLRKLIATGVFPPGHRLPAERELALQMRVNRPVLRKALGVLADEGAISRRIGRGTFVGRAAFGPGTPAIDDSATPMELIEGRMALEPAIAAEAALRARRTDLQRLRLCLRRASAASGFDQFEEWDVALHRSIAEATQNPIFVIVTDIFSRLRAVPEWDRLKRLSLDAERRDLYRRQHHEIVAAIAARDPKEAQRLMRDHLATIREALSGVGS